MPPPANVIGKMLRHRLTVVRQQEIVMLLTPFQENRIGRRARRGTGITYPPHLQGGLEATNRRAPPCWQVLVEQKSPIHDATCLPAASLCACSCLIFSCQAAWFLVSCSRALREYSS